MTSDRTDTPARARGAFTLVELLVVIAIIGVLISLLAPAIGGIREQADLRKCASNIRTCGTFYMAEAEDGEVNMESFFNARNGTRMLTGTVGGNNEDTPLPGLGNAIYCPSDPFELRPGTSTMVPSYGWFGTHVSGIGSSGQFDANDLPDQTSRLPWLTDTSFYTGQLLHIIGWGTNWMQLRHFRPRRFAYVEEDLGGNHIFQVGSPQASAAAFRRFHEENDLGRAQQNILFMDLHVESMTLDAFSRHMRDHVTKIKINPDGFAKWIP